MVQQEPDILRQPEMMSITWRLVLQLFQGHTMAQQEDDRSEDWFQRTLDGIDNQNLFLAG